MFEKMRAAVKDEAQLIAVSYVNWVDVTYASDEKMEKADRRREIGIRVAVGARGGVIARLVTGRVFSMVAVGVVAGVALGLASARYMESSFFQVKASDASMLAAPSAVILAVAVVATVPGILLALQIDPVEILRAE